MCEKSRLNQWLTVCPISRWEVCHLCLFLTQSDQIISWSQSRLGLWAPEPPNRHCWVLGKGKDLTQSDPMWRWEKGVDTPFSLILFKGCGNAAEAHFHSPGILLDLSLFHSFLFIWIFLYALWCLACTQLLWLLSGSSKWYCMAWDISLFGPGMLPDIRFWTVNCINKTSPYGSKPCPWVLNVK